jgi:hypothetical protein
MMGTGAALFRDVSTPPEGAAARLESVRHRGLKQAFQALRPGLMVCHPDTYQVRYANQAARAFVGLGDVKRVSDLPDQLTVTRQQEFVPSDRRHLACYRVEVSDPRFDSRALPVYSANGQAEAVLIVLRDYNDVSWSLFEMLDRLPMAIAAVDSHSGDVRYINRIALREVYALRSPGLLKRVPRRQDTVLEETLLGLLRQTPDASEGCQEVTLGRSRVDLHYSRLGENESTTRLIYWDPRTTTVRG